MDFLNQLDAYLKSSKNIELPSSLPTVAGHHLDIYQLYTRVVRDGGFRLVSSRHLWSTIARSFGYPTEKCSKIGSTLKIYYEKYLSDFEDAHCSFPRSKAPDSSSQRLTRSSTTHSNHNDSSSSSSNHHFPPSSDFLLSTSLSPTPLPSPSLLSSPSKSPFHLSSPSKSPSQLSSPSKSPSSSSDDSCPPVIYIDDDDSSSSSEDSSSDEEAFGFVHTPCIPLSDFRLLADSIKSRYFHTADHDTIPLPLIEREYWTIISGAEKHTDVQYASDINRSHCKLSGFPLAAPTGVRKSRRRAADDSTTTSSSSSSAPTPRFKPWNLNELSRQPGSMFRQLDKEVPGIVTPFLYFGMCFASFCWHTEDNYLNSINYLHCGAPKQWYVVPSSGKALFEAAFRNCIPDLFQQDPTLLYALVTQISPVELQLHGVPVYRAVHYPGTAMITFPAAYHAGFNYGFNVAESVNFAPLDWVKWGYASISDYRQVPRSSAFSFFRFLLDSLSPENQLQPSERDEMKHIYLQIRDWEFALRDSLAERGML